jgi:hypothetical protein
VANSNSVAAAGKSIGRNGFGDPPGPVQNKATKGYLLRSENLERHSSSIIAVQPDPSIYTKKGIAAWWPMRPTVRVHVESVAKVLETLVEGVVREGSGLGDQKRYPLKRS